MPPAGSTRATVEVKLPELITAPEKRARAIVAAAQDGLNVAMTNTLDDVRAKKTVPVGVSGNLAASLGHTPPAITGSVVSSSFRSSGPAARYAAVIDQGRRAGQRMWYGWLYYARGQEKTRDGWRGGWVNRRMRDSVTSLAARLRAEGRKNNAEKQAAFMLARSIARKIKARGIQAREFFRRYARPGADQRRLVQRFDVAFRRSLRRRGATG